MILAGDIGGTKSILGLFEGDPPAPQSIHETEVATARFSSLEELVAAYISERSARPDRVCLGLAGPVIDGRCDLTNLGWRTSEESLSRAIGGAPVKLLNDLEATAYGALCLPPDDFAILNEAGEVGMAGVAGMARPGNIALIAAGTGLGEAILHWDGHRHIAMATEGGHADFAARNDIEWELCRWIAGKIGGRVSVERILSGPGLATIYSFLRERGGSAAPAWLAERMARVDPSAAISEAALAGEDPICVDALSLFVSVYGAEAGNLALRSLAVGGIFVAGGIAPKILPTLQGGLFMEALTDKGRFAPLLRSLPVRVILNSKAALIGAAARGLGD